MRYRYRLSYKKSEAMRYTSNLDVHKSWERIFRRANFPLSYSQGFHPQPKIQLACPLPLGFLSEHEILDVELTEEFTPEEIRSRLAEQVPAGFLITDVRLISEKQPSLQVQTLASEYKVEFLEPVEKEMLESACHLLIHADNLPRVRRGKAYDLRPLIEHFEYISDQPDPHLLMILSAREAATGRPEEVLNELNIPVNLTRITRLKTILMTESQESPSN